jgi:hypothetical protein
MIAISRQTVDLSGYPDLHVVYLGMRAHGLGGIRALLKIGPGIAQSAAAKPDGLLLHEPLYYSLIPPHLGMRQYWRDFESLERRTREMPHLAWWKEFLTHAQSVSFWHETYSIRGGMESVYLNTKETGDHPGFLAFAPVIDAKTSLFSARRRLHRGGLETASPVPED